MNLHSHQERSRARRIPQSRVGIGSTFTIREIDSEEREVYTLVRPNDADIERNRISSFSPLGKAVGGRGVGDVVEIDAPLGILRYQLEAVLGPPEEAAVEIA